MTPTPAAPPVPAMEADEGNIVTDTEVVEVNEDGSDIAPDADAPDETAPDAGEGDVAGEVAETPETPETPAPAVVPTTLLNLRGAGGALDETLVAKLHDEHAQLSQFGANLNAMIQTDPAFKTAYAKALKAKGVALPDEWEALTVEAPPAPKYTVEQVKAAYNKLVAEGRNAEALQMWDEHVVQPREQARMFEEKRFREEQMRQQRKQIEAQRAAEIAAQQKTSWAQAAKDYPSVLVADPNLAIGFRIKDPAIAAKFAEVNKQLGDTATLRDVLDVTLARMGRLGRPVAKVATKPVPAVRKPTLPNTAKADPKSPKWVPKFSIAGVA